MSESDVIARGGRPLTATTLSAELHAMGLRRGDIVLMHCALSRIGWVVGGAQTVLSAVRAVIGSEGTLAMPAHSGQLTDPADWTNPPVPPNWVQVIRDHMPLFDPSHTPTRGMGQVAEALRAHPRILRSTHPTVSLMAEGPLAADLVATHPLDCGLGLDTPWGRLYDRNARALLLGAGWEACTVMHLAEYRAEARVRRRSRLPVRRDHGGTVWQEVDEVEGFYDRFDEIGAAFERASPEAVTRGLNGAARLFSVRRAVDFAVAYVDATGATRA